MISSEVKAPIWLCGDLNHNLFCEAAPISNPWSVGGTKPGPGWNGKLTYPVKGATLIGNGPDALTRVSMIGNNLELDSGVGTCGKDGQSVPVGVGQPTLRIDGLTIGGTAS